MALIGRALRKAVLGGGWPPVRCSRFDSWARQHPEVADSVSRAAQAAREAGVPLSRVAPVLRALCDALAPVLGDHG